MKRRTFMTTSTSFAQDAADRLAVVEALYRFAAGIDLRDSKLLASSLAENAVSDFRPAAAKAGFEYPVIEGREVIVSALTTSLAALDTTHSVSNPRVTIDGDTARMDVLVEAQHVPRSDPSRHYLMKNRYDVELVRNGEVWLITRNTVDNVWRSGDIGVLAGI
jgi:septum formation inhibitor-activating ATPase MinD